jgi:hypothetical protein
MTIKNYESITPKECAKLIRKKFKPSDRIIVYNENPAPPYDEGWAIDKARFIIKTLEDPEVFPDNTKYHFTVGLVKIDTNIDFY